MPPFSVSIVKREKIILNTVFPNFSDLTNALEDDIIIIIEKNGGTTLKILNFGSLNIDNVYSVKHFVSAGETVSANSFEKFVGGKGLNQSIALARAGAEVYHAGAVGAQDGEILTETLLKNGVNTDFVKKSEVPSGNAAIQVDENGENSIIVFSGANGTVGKEQIDGVLSHFSKGDFLLVQNEISNVGYIIEKAHEKEMFVVFNPSPLTEDALKLPFEKVSYLVVNESEAKRILNTDNSDMLCEKLSERYPDTCVLVTLGKKGSVYRDRNGKTVQKGYAVDAVDSTGAGDTFTGYFVGRISQGDGIEKALDTASRAAAISATVKGASNSIPTYDDVVRYLFDKDPN